jgi:hypothetical protein
MGVAIIDSVTTPPESEPFQWGASTIGWKPNGYALTVPMYLNARATQLLEAALPDVIPASDFKYVMREALWTKLDSGTSVEPGELQIVSQSFFDVAPEELRQLIDQAANRARRKADQEQSHDDDLAASFLAGLRGT